MPPSPYVYSPLGDEDSIRLLEVQRRPQRWPFWPNFRHDTGRERLANWTFDIVEVKMASAPTYEAVSYVWGDPEKPYKLQIGQDHTLPITASVLTALPYLLARSTTGYIWIDQICINQGDVKERNRQVQFMGNIFKGAERVLAWLGEMDKNESVPLFKLLQAVHQETENFLKNTDGSSSEASAYSNLAVMVQGDNRYLKALVALLNRPWFTRAWIVQEAVLCQTIYLLVGNVAIVDVLDLYSILRVLQNHIPKTSHEHKTVRSTLGYDGAWSLGKMRALRHRHEKNYKLYHVLSRMSPRKVSDPRDHVYAFLGFVDDPGIVITPDYSIRAEETFIRCARSIIYGSRSLDIINTIRPKDQFSGTAGLLPSWVPDWSKVELSDPIFNDTTSFHGPKNLFRASLGRLQNVSAPRDSNSRYLHIHGKSISDITFVTKRYDSRQSSQFGAKAYLQSHFPVDYIAKQLQFNCGIEAAQTRERLARVVAVDGGRSEYVIGQHYHPLSKQKISEIMEKYDRCCELDGLSAEIVLHGVQLFLTEYRDLLLSVTGRTVFITNDGKLGLGPTTTVAGDQIIIAHGSRVPLILRPADSDGKFWLVGTCYLEEIMYGEACTWAEDEADEFILI